MTDRSWRSWHSESAQQPRYQDGYATISREARDKLWKAKTQSDILAELGPSLEAIKQEYTSKLKSFPANEGMCAQARAEFEAAMSRFGRLANSRFDTALKAARRRQPSLLRAEEERRASELSRRRAEWSHDSKARSPENQGDFTSNEVFSIFSDSEPKSDYTRGRRRTRQASNGSSHRVVSVSTPGTPVDSIHLHQSPETRLQDSPEAVFEEHDHQWLAVKALETLVWTSIPWPSFFPSEGPQDLSIDDILTYLQAPRPLSDGVYLSKDRFRKHLRRWHHDRFETLLPKVHYDDQEKVINGRALVVSVLLWAHRFQPAEESQPSPLILPYRVIADTDHLLMQTQHEMVDCNAQEQHSQNPQQQLLDEICDVGHVEAVIGENADGSEWVVAEVDHTDPDLASDDDQQVVVSLPSRDQTTDALGLKRAAIGQMGAARSLDEEARKQMEKVQQMEDAALMRIDQAKQVEQEAQHRLERARQLEEAANTRILEAQRAEEVAKTRLKEAQQQEEEVRRRDELVCKQEVAALGLQVEAQQLMEQARQLEKAARAREEHATHVEEASRQLQDLAQRRDEAIIKLEEQIQRRERTLTGHEDELRRLLEDVRNREAEVKKTEDSLAIRRDDLNTYQEAIRREAERLDSEKQSKLRAKELLSQDDRIGLLARYAAVIKLQSYLFLYGESLRSFASLCEGFVTELQGIDYITPKQYENIRHWYKEMYEFVNRHSGLDPIAALAKWKEIMEIMEQLTLKCPPLLRQHAKVVFGSSILRQVDLSETLHAIKDAVSLENVTDRLMQLDRADALSISQLLDTVLHGINVHNLRLQCLYMLKKICEAHFVLPESFALPEKALFAPSRSPKARGGFAVVYKGTYGGRDVAFKVFKDHGDSDIAPKVKRYFYAEAVLWKHLNHPKITPFHGVDYTLFSLALVCEWMPRGTVISYLTEHPTVNRLKLMVDIAEALNYLHDSDIVHGDLKGSNILVGQDQVARLADFGLAGWDPEIVLPTHSVHDGSIPWMAPETIDPESSGLKNAWYSTQSDVYSFSLTMWEMFTGQIPFHPVNNYANLMLRIMQGQRPLRPPPSQADKVGFTDAVWALMESCWQGDRIRRPSISIVLETLSQAHRDQ